MEILRLTLGPYETNCYLVIKEDKCLIIDPSDSADLILKVIEDKKISPLAILCTHGHSDHIKALEGILRKFSDLKIYCNKKEISDEKYTIEFGEKIPTLASFDNLVFVDEKSKIKIGDFEVAVMDTPGHTPGSVMFIIEDYIFSGDTIFKLGRGRTDFEGGDDRDMFNSMRRIYHLNLDDYIILPGHGEETTLGYEKNYNPYLTIFKKGIY